MFRLDTAEKRAAYRASMIPTGAVRDERSTDAGEVWLYAHGDRLFAIAFRGTSGRPAFHYRFRTVEQRERSVAEFFQAVEATAKYKAEQKAIRTAYVHDVKPGDVFMAMWGYDQTNVDYYQCVRLIGSHMAEMQPIAAQSQETAWLQGDCVPAPGKFCGKPFRVRIQGYQGEPYFKVASYANAHRMKPVAEVAGVKVYGASHWTAYA